MKLDEVPRWVSGDREEAQRLSSEHTIVKQLATSNGSILGQKLFCELWPGKRYVLMGGGVIYLKQTL